MSDKVTVPLSSPSPSNSTSRSSLGTWFSLEIQNMMHGLGDCRKPILQSAILIEKIAHQQMTLLLLECADIATNRNSRFIGIEDLIFLLRKDKVKLRRLLRYIMLKDQKNHLDGAINQDDSEHSDVTEMSAIGPSFKKRTKMARDFLLMIDNTGELINLMNDQGVDAVKHERMLRADIQTCSMDKQQYLEFCESRQQTLNKKNKFRDWVMSGVNLDIKTNIYVTELLGYFTYEIIAQIVDMALLAKYDGKMMTNDPLTPLLPPVSVNHPDPKQVTLPLPEVSPTNMPPITPTPPTSATPTNTTKTKAKKRKKSGQTLLTTDLNTLQPIEPRDISEAYRRYQQVFSPFATCSKSSRVPDNHWLLCC